MTATWQDSKERYCLKGTRGGRTYGLTEWTDTMSVYDAWCRALNGAPVSFATLWIVRESDEKTIEVEDLF